MGAWALRARTLLVMGLVLVPGIAAAQSTISGAVTDTTGAVMPGVSVEASSPALIEKTRFATTDDQGRYTIVDVRPGVYSVKFTLQGFTSVTREGIQIAANITVPINAELKVGSVAETITVTGATPMVDVQQAAQRQVLGREQLDTLPTARSFLSTGVVVPAAKISRPDMGGVQVGQASYLSARGRSSNDNAVEVDGIDVRISNGVSQSGYNNFAMVQDVTYQTSAMGPDAAGGGVRINMIPRDGGNRFSGDFFVGGSFDGWQKDNLTQELRDAGLRSADALKHLIEATPAVGGPILRDRVWFFGSVKYSEVQVSPAGSHYFATGDPGITTNDLHNVSGRVTWQISPRNKVSGYVDRWFKSQDHTITFTAGECCAPGVDWETATSTYPAHNSYLSYVKWTSPLTSRLLVETGFSAVQFPTEFGTPLPGIVKDVGTPEWYAGALKQDITLNTFVGQSNFSSQFAEQPSYAVTSSVSYVTGSHNVKAGMQYRYANSDSSAPGANAHLTQQYQNRLPVRVLVYAVPHEVSTSIDEFAAFAMDSWVINRLTVTGGLRLDRFGGQVNPMSLPAGRFVGARSFPELHPTEPFFDLSPRVSAVYDLFGNAHTALKFSANKYLTPLSVFFFNPFAPNSSTPDTRIWQDTDFIPGSSTPSGAVLATNGDNIAQDNEIGPRQNNRFGLAAEQRADSDLQREFSWDYSASVQHEIRPNLSVMAGWYYSATHDAQQTINVLRSISDYTPFQVVNPYIPSEMVTIYRLNNNKVGVVDNVTTNSSVNHRDYQSYEVSVTSRLLSGGTMNFGWAMERVRRVSCDTPNPNLLRFCDHTGGLYQELGAVPAIPYRHEYKFSMSQEVPYQFIVGASFVSFSGANRLVGATGGANVVGTGGSVAWPVPAAQFPGGITEAVTVPLLAPGISYLDRWNQLDLSVRRSFKVGQRFELRPALELYNVTNGAVVLSRNNNFGPALDAPLSVLQGRFTKLSVLVKF
jgi:Carboxypeptidase regulatory-like domain